MRHIASTLMLIAWGALASGQAMAQTFSAADLKSVCTDAKSEVCAAYIAGYTQGFYYSAVSAQAGFTPCPVPNLSEPSARLITTKFLNDHPEALGQGAASVVAEALVTAFPCGEAK